MIFTYCILCLCIAIVLISTFVRNALDRRARARESARVWREYVDRDSIQQAQIKAIDEWMTAHKAPNHGESFIVRNDQ